MLVNHLADPATRFLFFISDSHARCLGSRTFGSVSAPKMRRLFTAVRVTVRQPTLAELSSPPLSPLSTDPQALCNAPPHLAAVDGHPRVAEDKREHVCTCWHRHGLVPPDTVLHSRSSQKNKATIEGVFSQARLQRASSPPESALSRRQWTKRGGPVRRSSPTCTSPHVRGG